MTFRQRIRSAAYAAGAPDGDTHDLTVAERASKAAVLEVCKWMKETPSRGSAGPRTQAEYLADIIAEAFADG